MCVDPCSASYLNFMTWMWLDLLAPVHHRPIRYRWGRIPMTLRIHWDRALCWSPALIQLKNASAGYFLATLILFNSCLWDGAFNRSIDFKLQRIRYYVVYRHWQIAKALRPCNQTFCIEQAAAMLCNGGQVSQKFWASVRDLEECLSSCCPRKHSFSLLTLPWRTFRDVAPHLTWTDTQPVQYLSCLQSKC